jgi:hypothetical protein
MLKYATKATHVFQGAAKASAIVATLKAPSRLYKPSETTPPRARRMSYYGIGTIVSASVASFVPYFDVGQAGICASRINI